MPEREREKKDDREREKKGERKEKDGVREEQRERERGPKKALGRTVPSSDMQDHMCSLSSKHNLAKFVHISHPLRASV